MPQPQIPSRDNFGLKLEDNKWLPVTTALTPAPKAASAVTYISTTLTCVTAEIVKTSVRTAVVQMMILKTKIISDLARFKASEL